MGQQIAKLASQILLHVLHVAPGAMPVQQSPQAAPNALQALIVLLVHSSRQLAPRVNIAFKDQPVRHSVQRITTARIQMARPSAMLDHTALQGAHLLLHVLQDITVPPQTRRCSVNQACTARQEVPSIRIALLATIAPRQAARQLALLARIAL